MNPATIGATTFTLAGTGAAGNVTYDVPNQTAIFTPSAPLALDSPYTATVTTGAQDLLGAGLASDFTWSFTTSAVVCQAPVPLGSAANFADLAGSTITNTGPTVITGGDLALSPGSAVTGFPPGVLTPPAVMHIDDTTAAQAQLDLTAAYNYAAGVLGAAVLTGDLSGLTFTPGVYKNSSTVMLSAGQVFLDGQGDPNAVFIFQIGSTLTTFGRHAGCPDRWNPGEERLLAGFNVGHAGNQLHLRGNDPGAAVDHARYRRCSDRPGLGS